MYRVAVTEFAALLQAGKPVSQLPQPVGQPGIDDLAGLLPQLPADALQHRPFSYAVPIHHICFNAGGLRGFLALRGLLKLSITR